MNKKERISGQMENGNPKETDKDSPKTNFGSKIAYTLQNVTVEPLLGIFQMASILSNLTTQNLNFQKACRVNLQLNDTVCNALQLKNGSAQYKNGSELYKDAETMVQVLSVNMMIWQNVIQNLIPCILVVFIGSWSDRNQKRKPFMLLPILGEVIRNAGLLVCVYFFYELPMEVAGIIESVPSSITGSLPVLFMAVFAYVGDISTIENRTFRVGMVSLFASVSVPVGAALSGILYKQLGFYGVYNITLALYLFTFVYGILVIKEEKQIVKKENDGVSTQIHGKKSYLLKIYEFFDLKHIQDAFYTTFKAEKNNRRLKISLIMLVIVFVLGPLTAEQQLTYMLTRIKYQWNEVHYSLYSTYYFICNLIGIGFTLTVLVNWLKIDDRLIGAMGCLSKVLGAFVYGLAPNQYIFYLAPLVDIFHGTSLIAIRSILSKLVPANELGKVLAIVSLVETIVPAIFRPMFSLIYSSTLHTLPGTFYIVGGIIVTPSIFIFLWMYGEHLREEREKNEFLEEKEALKKS
ncbi:proton-coupled folate transporter-like [Adelges cooleyi]|uniref:proton-coupled folate transporter-like n=1 Tax=Adelges cooleyi TaxID=133065 RepID=UPI0021806307|nr:proton-coupled folate transporter-like [Adelges cooleyi]XP_050443436.1 proton-coupled folate transporter-like [Adelges cooleyi]